MHGNVFSGFRRCSMDRVESDATYVRDGWTVGDPLECIWINDAFGLGKGGKSMKSE